MSYSDFTSLDELRDKFGIKIGSGKVLTDEQIS